MALLQKNPKARAILSTVKHQIILSRKETFKHYLSEKTIDIYAVTESWIHADATEESLKGAVPDGYAISSKPRKDGGGI